MSLSSIRTWGWFPTSAGGDASISSIRTWGWLFDEEGPPPEHFDEGPPMEEHYEEGNADEGGEY